MMPFGFVSRRCVRATCNAGPGNALPQRGREPFVRVTWEKAETLLSEELKRVIEQYGNAAIYGGSYGWASAGRFHHAQSQIHRFLNCMGGYTRSVDTYSVAAGEVILHHVLGDSWRFLIGPTSWPVITKHTQCFVAFGGLPLKNTQVSAGGMLSHDQQQHMVDAKNAGVAFYNISPIKTDVAESLDARWIAARPNTDVAIMLGVAFDLISNDHHDRAFLQHYCEGADQLIGYVLGKVDGVPKTPKWAAEIAGVPVDSITDLAQAMVGRRCMISVSWSLTRQQHGEQPYWMAVALAALLGQIGLPGGGVGFGYGAENKVGIAQTDFQLGSFPSLASPCDSFIPVARIADMLLNPGAEFDYNGKSYQYPNTKLVYWAGGNPFHHHQDLNRLHRAWQKPDTVVSHEIWWNATARHADIVLPVTSPLERNDLGGASGGNILLAMQKAVEPTAEARDDYHIFSNLSERLNKKALFTEGLDENGWIKKLYEQTRHNAEAKGVKMPEFEAFWEQGSFIFPQQQKDHIILEKFRADPNRYPLDTPSGRIQLSSPVIGSFNYDDCHRYPTWQEPSEWLGARACIDYPLHLVTNQPKTRLHSQLDNGKTSQRSKVQGKEPILISTDDAIARGIRDGDVVKVHNTRGAFLAGAVVSDTIRPGVVQIATGAWWDPDFEGEKPYLCRHGNPNSVTPDIGTSKLAQGPSALTCLVEVTRCDDDVPDSTVLREPPEFI